MLVCPHLGNDHLSTMEQKLSLDSISCHWTSLDSISCHWTAEQEQWQGRKKEQWQWTIDDCCSKLQGVQRQGRKKGHRSTATAEGRGCCCEAAVEEATTSAFGVAKAVGEGVERCWGDQCRSGVGSCPTWRQRVPVKKRCPRRLSRQGSIGRMLELSAEEIATVTRARVDESNSISGMRQWGRQMMLPIEKGEMLMVVVIDAGCYDWGDDKMGHLRFRRGEEEDDGRRLGREAAVERSNMSTAREIEERPPMEKKETNLPTMCGERVVQKSTPATTKATATLPCAGEVEGRNTVVGLTLRGKERSRAITPAQQRRETTERMVIRVSGPQMASTDRRENLPIKEG
ncbi:hypothetical protein BHE74_00057741 [Ensete ventricosum]|nr:hypothetical protein BHE74_00057741 [Ensete ventricosum]